MWIECLLAASLWCLFLVVQSQFGRVEPRDGKEKHRVRTFALGVLISLTVIMLIPPLGYIAKVRYNYWTTQVLPSYVVVAQTRIDQEAASGALQSARSRVDVAAEILKGTAEEGRLDDRRRILDAIIRRSEMLDKASMVQSNLVTQRPVFFSLVESVRINPENSAAADRLAQKLEIVKGFLDNDAASICSSQGVFNSFQGKAVAGIEARLLWDAHGTSNDCVASVKNDLADGWGIARIRCLLDLNQSIRRGDRNPSLDAKTCPEGPDFWSPSEVRSGYTAAVTQRASHHPAYPTVLDLWRKYLLKKKG
jgi:hypothetical protein